MPEVTLQETAAGGYDVPDVYGSSYDAGSLFGSSTLLAMGRTSGGKVGSFRSLVSFDLEDGEIFVPVKVIGSKFSGYVNDVTADPGVASYLYRVVRTDWIEGQANWGVFKTANSWTTVMCDHATNDMTTANGQSFTSPTSTGGWVDVEGSDLDAQVQYALDNDVSPNRTVHLLIRVAAQGTSEANDTYWTIRSSNHTTEAHHPKLWVQYRRMMSLSDARRWLRWFKLFPAMAPAAFIGFIINRRMIIERTPQKILYHGLASEYKRR